MICPNCQKETPNDQNTCVHCGAVTSSTNNTIMPDQTPEKKKKGGIAKVIIPIIVAIVVVIIINIATAGPSGTAVLEMSQSVEGIDAYTKQTFNYKNDIVTEFTEVLEMKTPDGVSDDEFEKFCIELVKEQYKSFDSISFISYSYDMDGDTFKVTVEYKDLDNEANVDKMEDLGLTEGELDLISFTATKENLIKDGYTVVSED